MKNKPLRFAGLVRVSTEGQKGEECQHQEKVNKKDFFILYGGLR